MKDAGTGKPQGGEGALRIAVALLLVLSPVFLLTACPDVDLSDFSNSSGDKGGAAIGPVAGFGGLKVAGVEFTDNASTTVVDDRGRGIGDLAEGMAVNVRGTIGGTFRTGSATSVTIERELRGPVDDNGVALDNGTIRVFGQAVILTLSTVVVDSVGVEIGLADIENLLDNGFRPGLEIHGGIDDNGAVHAAYIEQVQDNVVAGDTVDLRGRIAGFDGLTRRFRIGEQEVDYTGMPTAGRVDWPVTGLADGLFVDVRGTLDTVGGNGVLLTDRTGDRIRVITVSLGASTERVALEGYVLSGDSSSFSMSVPGGAVTVNSGVAPSGDAFGVRKKVRVTGTLSGSAGTVVQAASVSVPRADDILLQGPPGGLPSAGDTITLLGRTVEVDDHTIFRDATGAVREGFGLASLAAGDIVRVAGYFDESSVPGKVAASRIDRLAGTAGRVTIQGPVSAPVGAPSMSIIGVTVITDGIRTAYFDKGAVPLAGQNEFFLRLASLGAGTVVRVRDGVFVAGSSRIDPPSAGADMEVEIVTVNR